MTDKQGDKIKKIDEQIKELKEKMNDPHLCEDTADVYTRVSGYYRPVTNFNAGKQSEMVERLEYDWGRST
jgi:anaerobic ribonucleoside-triphosphate reductase